MKSLQEYIELYRGVARRLNLQGDSIEMLSQLLGNATYISEVEHMSYTQEASLERASQLNSKIQHCMNEMYSVFRGSCPRVLIHFTSLSYLEYNIFDEIATFNNFSLYYLGYAGDSSEITYSPISIPPNQEMTIIALISPKKLRSEWTINFYNQFYVDFLESNLSNDIQVRVDGELCNTTRIFSDHIKDNSLVFDLTLPDYGLRLYAPEIFKEKITTSIADNLSEIPTGTKISLEAFRFSELSSYNVSELKQIKIKGTKLKAFDLTDWNSYGSELSDGLIFIKEVPRDSSGTLHYKAHRDKFVGSILRSNSDVGYLLEEMYPEKIRKSGTSFKFESTNIIPKTKSTFGFIPEDSLEEDNYKNLSGSSTVDEINKETRLVNSSNSTNPLTVYSSKSNQVDVYFNNNPSVNYYPGDSFSSNIKFTGTKLSLVSPGLFKDGAPFGGIVRIPISGSGTLRVYHKASFDLATNAVYEIKPSRSVILRNRDELITTSLDINVIRSLNGVFEILSGLDKNLKFQIIYKYGNTQLDAEDFLTKSISLDWNTIKNNNVEEILIRLVDSSSNIVLDNEVIPIVYTEGEETNETSKESSLNLSLDLSNDGIFLESNSSGEIITPLPITIQASLFSGGKQVTSGVIYSLTSPSGIQCNISNQGLLSINSIDILEPIFSILVEASYQGQRINSEVIIKTRLSSDAFKSRSIVISDDSTGLTSIQKVDVGLVGQLSEIKYINRSNETSLYLWLEGTPSVDIYLLEWVKDEEIDLTSSQVYPKLTVYYIPNSASSILTKQEIDNYINSRKSYFVTQNISVLRGRKIKVLVTLEVELFRNFSIDSDINQILSKYSNLFNIDLEKKRNEIVSSIGKISNVKSLSKLEFSYKTELGDIISSDDYNYLDFDTTYFEIDYKINSFVAG